MERVLQANRNIVNRRFRPNPAKIRQIPSSASKSRNIPPNPAIGLPDRIPSGLPFRKGLVPSNPFVWPLERVCEDFKEIYKRDGIWTQPPFINPCLGSTVVQGLAILFATSPRKRGPHCGWLLKWAFAVEHRSSLGLRFLVLSALNPCLGKGLPLHIGSFLSCQRSSDLHYSRNLPLDAQGSMPY